MIKLSFCLTRLDHLTRDEFHDYWFNKHAPLVKSVFEDLRIIKYEQLHCQSFDYLNDTRIARVPNDKLPYDFDGIAELYWESWEILKNLSNNENSRKAGKILLEDEAKFIKFKESPLMFSEIKNII